VAREHEPGLAAGVLADAVRGLQRREERVLEERVVVAREGVPSLGRDLGDALCDADVDGVSSLAGALAGRAAAWKSEVCPTGCDR
jgi:hypothetical protein